MNPHHVGAVHNGHSHRGGGGVEGFFGIGTGGRWRKERLARGAGKDGALKRGQLAQMREDLDVLLAALAKTQAGIDGDAITVHTRAACAVNGGLQIARHRTDHVWQRRQLGPGFRRAAHVIQNQACVGVGHGLGKIGIEREPARVIDDFDAVFKGALGGLGFIGIERDRNRQLIFQPLQYGDETAPLFFGGDAFRAGAGGFAAYVDDVGALFFKFEGAGVSAVGVGEVAAVGERVGSNVENTHDEGLLAQLEFDGAQLPVIDLAVHCVSFQLSASAVGYSQIGF